MPILPAGGTLGKKQYDKARDRGEALLEVCDIPKVHINAHRRWKTLKVVIAIGFR